MEPHEGREGLSFVPFRVRSPEGGRKGAEVRTDTAFQTRASICQDVLWGEPPLGIEDNQTGTWLLLDCTVMGFQGGTANPD